MYSLEMFQRAQDCIAQGALTNSKHPENHVLGVYPTHLGYNPGSGAYLYDTDDNQYVDYICGLGTNLLGYGNGYVSEAVKAKIQCGQSHSLPTIYEIEAAEALKSMFVFVDRFKFLKSGSQACTAAIKIARAYTGRKIVLSEGYHGHEDEFVSLTKPAKGVHTCTEIFPLSESVNLGDVAAIIVEPVITDGGDARVAELARLRELCDKNGILLIYDETITGLRYNKHSVALSTNILPDLIVLGKALANGFPLAAVGGKRKVMDGDYFVSSTYAGEILSLIACKATVHLLMHNYQYSIERLWEAGQNFIGKFNSLANPRIRLVGYPTRGVFEGSEMDVALLRQEAAKAKILLHKTWFYNFPLMKEDYLFFTFLQEFVRNLEGGRLKLQGELPKSPFAQRVRDEKGKGHGRSKQGKRSGKTAS